MRSTFKNALLHRIIIRLQLYFDLFPGLQKVFQDLRQYTAHDPSFNKEVAIRSLLILLHVQVFQLVMGDQSRIAQVMRHHDRGIQGGEIKHGHWVLEVASGWLDDHSAFVLTLIACLVSWDEEAKLLGLAIKLGCYLDLLSSREEIRYGHAADPRDLSRHEQALQFSH